MKAKVIAVCKHSKHSFSKTVCPSIELLKDLGVQGDAHCGKQVKHRSRVRQNPNQPNLRQVHLIHSELFNELEHNGYQIYPGNMGENITTSNIDLLGLPTNTILRIGNSAEIKITGLRNPCTQLNHFQAGLMDQLVHRDNNDKLVRKAGIMAIVTKSGLVKPGDHIISILPKPPFVPLDRV